MADFSNLQAKFIRIYESNPQYRMLSVESAMAQMVKDGVLTKAEYEQLVKTSLFGFGFNTNTAMGLSFERTTSKTNQNEQQAKKIASSVKESSRWYKDWGGSSLVAECKKTTKDNILYTLKEFEKVSPDKNLVLTITDNSTIPVEKQKEALKHIFNVLCSLAKDKGVDTTHFEKAFKTNISQTRTETRVSSTGMPSGTYTKEVLTDSNITTINNIIVGLRNSIEVKASPNVYNQIALALTPEEQIQEQTICSLKYKHSSSLEALENQNRYDGWAGELADWMSGAWGSKNREKYVRADLEKFNKQISELEEAKKVSKEAFEQKFEEIFGIKYDAELIVNYQQVEQLYQIATSCYQLEQFFKSDLNVLLSNSTLHEETKTVSIDPMTNMTQTTVLATKEQVFEREFNKLANFVGQGNLENGKQQLEEVFKASALTETSTLQEKYTVLRQVAQEYAKVLHNNTMQVTGNKGYETIAKDFDDAYKSAFGVTNDIARRVAEYNVSQQSGAGVIKSTIMIGGTIALGAITGGVGLSFFPALAITSVGAGAITATTEFSDRLSSGYVVEGFKENGLVGAIEGAKQALPDEEIIRILKSSGITTLAVAAGGLLGAGVEIGAQALNMSILTKSLAHVAVGTGVGAVAEYLHTGTVSVQGVIFAFVLSAVGQVIAITKVGVMNNGKVTFDKQAIQQARQELGLADDVVLTEEILKKAYRKMSVQTHPDKGGSAEAFIKVRSAYALLMQYTQPATATGVKSSSSQTTTKSNSTTQAEVNPNLPVVTGDNALLTSPVQTTVQNSGIVSRLAVASSREDFAAIRDEIKAMSEDEYKVKLSRYYAEKTYKIFLSQVDKAKTSEELDKIKNQYRENMAGLKCYNGNELKNISKTIEEKYSIIKDSTELKNWLDDNHLNQIIKECTKNDGRIDATKLHQKTNYVIWKNKIFKIVELKECEKFEKVIKSIPEKELDKKSKAELEILLYAKKIEMLNLYNSAKKPDGSLDIDKYIEMSYKPFDEENIRRLKNVLLQVVTISECEYLVKIIKNVKNMSAKQKSTLLNLVEEKRIECFEKGDESSYVSDRVGEEISNGQFNPFKNVKINFLEYPIYNEMYDRTLNEIIKCENIDENGANIFPLEKNSLRGRNIVSFNTPDLFVKAKENGLRCIIDLRSEDALKSKGYELIEIDDKIYIKHKNEIDSDIPPVRYLKFPIDHASSTLDFDTIKILEDFFELMDSGNLYIGCSNGLHRTDFALALNYVLNTTTKDVPTSKDSEIIHIRNAVRRIYGLINYIKITKPIEEWPALGLSENLINRLPKNEQEFNDRLARLPMM